MESKRNNEDVNKGAPPDEAVAVAADHLASKINRQHEKYCKRSEHKLKLKCIRRNTDEIQCDCEEMKMKLEDGTKSPVFSSPVVNRKFARREGVAELNEADRKIAKEVVKGFAKTANLTEHQILIL